MSDLISRQAAIDVLRGYFDGMLETDTWRPCDVYGLIEVLPSAQPEIIRCKDCRYTDEDGVCQSSKGLAIQDDDDFCSHAERREG